ncbi:MAG: bifunctional hydroxymethylpyrimidine kinase/phosphomethylpyrimidine kinase [Eggerthellaceae bacterium]|nr:bifunctional hydroxymethylpyrimidine kinase/phosphomethylpyrimidine kinase [Eggerthellaceae bacterium]
MTVETASPILYHRQGAYIPRIAAVHDLCGYGKCSLGVAIPVLSAAGCDVCPVPTGIFSSHTAFPGWYMYDVTEALPAYLEAWAKINVEIDAVYSGFLGAPSHVDRIRELYEAYPEALRLVDPVMADHGKVYPTYTPELCAAMVELAQEADILTPNLTEAAIILGREWPGQGISDEEAAEWVRALLEAGAKNVVLKGIHRKGEAKVYNFVGSGELDDEGQVVAGEILRISNPYLPYQLHGTGDVYASALLAAIMCGRSVADSAAFAGNMVYEAMVLSAKQPRYLERGVSFEPLLGKVCALLG